MRLNIGAGWDYKKGFCNIDISPTYHPDKIGDVRTMKYPSESVNEIVASHVLVYFPYPECREIISRFYEWLKLGGRLELRFPDFDKIVEKASHWKDAKRGGVIRWGAINYNLFGDYKQTIPEVLKCIWKSEPLIEFLEGLGFSNVTLLEPRDEWEFGVEAFK